MNFSPALRAPFLALAFLAVAGCSGGSSSGAVGPSPPPPPPPPPPPSGEPTNAQRIAAATVTAQNNAECVKVQPFYWEIGDKAGLMAAGSVSGPGDPTITADTKLTVASASKWFYSSYWVQRIGGGANLTPTDIKFFNFWSGYTKFLSCSGDPSPTPTVASCLSVGENGVQDASTLDQFDYGGGHMQVHAATIAGLGALNNTSLAAEIEAQVGTDIDLTYTEPQLAGGAFMATSAYARLLRKIVAKELLMSDVLGTHQVCTNSKLCPGQALGSPAPSAENWRYSIGHWVEDTTNDSDGAFSSAGAFGFYPWIDKTKTYYGVLARFKIGGALTSVYCGRQVRKAWVSGVAQ